MPFKSLDRFRAPDYLPGVKSVHVIALSGACFIVALSAAGMSLGDRGAAPLSAVAEAAPQKEDEADPGRAAPYRSSIVGTEYDFITGSDPTTFERLEFVGRTKFEMPDKRDDGDPLVQDAYVFTAYFTDGAKIQIALDSQFGSREAAEEDALRYGPRLGRLPLLYRSKIRHITVNFGGEDTTAFAEDKGHFFTIYSANASKRIGTNDLEETFFHEGTHASIQADHINSSEWKDAVARDGAYITEYAKSSSQEDFAESALFAYTILKHPERFPATTQETIRRTIPNRIAFFRRIFSE